MPMDVHPDHPGEKPGLFAGATSTLFLWMWVKMEDLGDHRCQSSLVLTIQLLRYLILTHTLIAMLIIRLTRYSSSRSSSVLSGISTRKTRLSASDIGFFEVAVQVRDLKFLELAHVPRATMRTERPSQQVWDIFCIVLQPPKKIPCHVCPGWCL